VVLATGPARAVVDPVAGGRLAALRVHGLDLLVGPDASGGDPLRWGAYPMAPWVGRLAGGRFVHAGREVRVPADLGAHAIHGTVWKTPWRADAQGPVAVSLSCPLTWPLGGRASEEIRLGRDRLEWTLSLHAAQQSFPAACGWHPWWRRELGRGGSLAVEIHELAQPATRRFERDADTLPTGRLVDPGPRPADGWDDCFWFDGDAPTVVLRWPGVLTLRISSGCEYLVLYDQLPHALCVEPQTGPPDAFHLDRAMVVSPGAALTATMQWSWARD